MDDAGARVVAEARRWRGTPYRDNARVLGHGVDCARLLIAVYSAAGLIEDFDPGYFPADWYLHRSEEHYVTFVERFAVEFDWRAEAIEAADIVAWRYGRVFSHGAIVTGNPHDGTPGWPWVIHAFAPYRVVDETDVRGTALATLPDGRERPMRAFRLKGLADGGRR